jgi:hypothetical protein
MGSASGELMANRIKPAEWIKRVKTATEKAKSSGS